MLWSPAQNELIKVYLAGFLRAPELSGFDYWSGRLSSASIHSLANEMFTLPVVQAIYPADLSGAAFIGKIYNNVFGKAPDPGGLAYWDGRLANGLGRGELVLEMINAGLYTPDGTPGKAYITNRFIGAQYAVEQQQNTHIQIHPDDLTQAMRDLGATPASLTAYSTEIRALALGSGAGRLIYSATTLEESAANDGSIGTALTVTAYGDTFAGAIGATLGKVVNTPAGLAAKLVKTADTTAALVFDKVASKHQESDSISNFTLALSAKDFTHAAAGIVTSLVRDDIKIKFYDANLSEAGGVLTGKGLLYAQLSIDLASASLSSSGKALSLGSGSMVGVHTVDLSQLAPPPAAKPSAKPGTVGVSLTGDAAANTLYASGYGGKLEGRAGNDTLYLGNATDTVKFAVDQATNGVDTLHDFKIGSGGDVLDFSAFLNLTGTSRISAFNADDPAALAANPWSNGDVLSVQGGGLNNAAAIAALFGAGAVYAAPTLPAKAVLISSDLVGDASIWYITTYAAGGGVDAGEVVQVGTLVGINNLSVVGFDATNFA